MPNGFVRVPVIVSLHDHLDVPSTVAYSACSNESMCVSGSTPNVILKLNRLHTYIICVYCLISIIASEILKH